MVGTVEAAFAIGSLLALLVAFLDGWTTGQVGGQWKHDSINRASERFEIAIGTKFRLMAVHALAAGAIFIVAGAAGAASIVNLLVQVDVLGAQDVAEFPRYQCLTAAVGIAGTVVAAVVAAWRTKVVLDQAPVPARLS